MGDDRKVTIITPVYNAEKDIEACILSVAGQSYSNKEHLLVDGASTDGTLAIIKCYAEKYPHIKLISEKDDGIYDAMNKGIDQASGEWIYFLGCDDVFYDGNVLEDIFRSYEMDSLDLVYGNVLWGETGEIYDGKFSLLKLMEKNLCHQSVFYRRTLFEKLGKFDTEFKSWADYLFNIKCFNSDEVRLKYLNVVVAKYGVQGFSSMTPDKDFIDKRGLIIQKHFPNEYFQFHEKMLTSATELEARNGQLADRDRQLADRDRQLAEFKSILDHKLMEIDSLNQKLVSIQQSLCWRMTKPVRFIADALLLMVRGDAPQTGSYEEWVERYDTLSNNDLVAIDRHITSLVHKPLYSVVMPVYNTPEKWLRLAIESVLAQRYPNWELCIADDASTEPHVRAVLTEYRDRDSRIKVVFREKNGHISLASNSALELVAGEFVVLLDHDDVLPVHSLYMVACELNNFPTADIIYSDEDKIDENGRRFNPHFKPDWNPDLFLSENYVSHLGVYRTSLIRRAGGFRVGYEGSQDYDLCLRCVANTTPECIRHIPRVLYHWRAIAGSTALAEDSKMYAYDAAVKALADYFMSTGCDAKVEPGTWLSTYRRTYILPGSMPLVSIIIPTRDCYELLHACIASIRERTDYNKYEIIIIDNQSTDLVTLDYLKKINDGNEIRVLNYLNKFNYSEINNFAVKHARGEIIALLNNDIEVISSNWLKEMVSYAIRAEIGAVGAKLYYPDGRIQHGGVILGLGGNACHSHKLFPRKHPGYFARLMVTQNLSAVTGACLVVRKSVYEEVGGLNAERLAIAFNDVDFCLKLVKAGYRNVWTPFAELYHHESISRGADDTPEKQDRFQQEIDYMQEQWRDILQNDPCYNPNLTLDSEDFSLAFPPRVEKPWEVWDGNRLKEPNK